jgi:hypothetical protein
MPNLVNGNLPPRREERANDMNSSFEEVWSDIRRRLRVGTIIPNWSVHGYTGKTFRIVGVDNTAVMVSSSRMQDKGKGRLVSRGEFERCFPIWPDYKAGMVQRTVLTARSQNTTYVISILHWQETPEGETPDVAG